MKRYALLFVLTFSLALGCGKPVAPPPPPEIVITRLENDTFQFQYSNGQEIETGTLMTFLDAWLKEHPEITVKSFVPQTLHYTDNAGKPYTKTHGMLVFTKIDPTKAKPEAKEAPKDGEKK